MSNVVLAFPNRAGSLVAYSGGAWSSTLPLSYLLTRQLAQIARAVNADARNTWFYMTAALAIDCGVFATCRHNLSATGQQRLRGYTNDPRPSLYLSFLNATAPAGLTVSRATATATYVGSDGLLKTAAENTARIEYDPTTGKFKGLWCEPTATNELTWSRDGTNAAWTKTSMATALTATGIDGATNSATRLTASLANARIQQASSVASTPYVWSVYLRRVSGSGTINLTADNFVSTSVATLTTSWQRFQLSSSAGAHTVGIQIVTSGDVIEMDYAQCEAGSVASSPVLASGSVATRLTEVITYTLSASIATWAVGSVAVSATLQRRPAGTLKYLQLSGGGATACEADCSITSGGVLSFDYIYNSIKQASVTGATLAAGDSFKAAGTWAANDVRASTNGSTGTPDSTATMDSGSATTLTIGGGVHMIVDRISLYATATTNADLNGLTGSGFEKVADYDSGLTDVWPAAFISGTTAEQRSGVVGLGVIKPGATQTYRYWRVDLYDESNSAGYLQLGRVFIGTAWSPTYNMSYGAGIGYEPRSSVIETDSGAEYFVARPNPRAVQFAFDYLSEAEAMAGTFEMQRQLGTTGELLFQWDPSDTLQMPRRSFLGRLRSLSKLQMPYLSALQHGVEIKELL